VQRTKVTVRPYSSTTTFHEPEHYETNTEKHDYATEGRKLNYNRNHG
jgi:hypothetical protein